MAELRAALTSFAHEHGFRTRSAVALALVVTDRARREGLPIDPGRLLTPRGGQVAGLGRTRVQAILLRHGVMELLAAEGGRTSAGNLARAARYAGFLNSLPPGVDLGVVEAFWVERARGLLPAVRRALRLRLGTRSSALAAVADLLRQAAERQRAGGGVQYAGAVLQHLVGAKLECALGSGQVEHHGFSVSDEPGGRDGDFLLGDVAIHVTTAPGEALIARCRDNLEAGLRPIIVTLPRKTRTAEDLAENLGLARRIDVFDVVQFVALNIYQMGRFAAAGRKTSLAAVIDRYNEIIEARETDPSLQIELRG